jgi:hypothetical protein
MRRALIVILAVLTVSDVLAQPPCFTDADHSLRSAIRARANVSDEQLPGVVQQILDIHDQYDATMAFRARVTDNLRVGRFTDATRIGRIEILSHDEVLSPDDTWFAFALNGDFTNVSGRLGKTRLDGIALAPNPNFGRFENADFAQQATLSTANEPDDPIASAGEGLWSDTCWYYNPKDPFNPTTFHPDVWNGRDINGNHEGFSNQLEFGWLDRAQTLFMFRMGTVGANRALGYGYTRAIVRTVKGGADGVCAVFNANIGESPILPNEFVVIVPASDPRIQVSPGGKVDFVMTPQ